MKKYLYGLGAMLVGAGFMFMLMTYQVNRAKSETESIRAVAEAILAVAKRTSRGSS